MPRAKSDATHSVETIARLLLLTERRVQQLAKEGVIPKTGRGRYELVPAVQGYIRYLQERALGREDLGDPAQRLKAAQADMAEIDLRKARGEVVEVTEVATAVRSEYAVVRTRLGSLPGRLAPKVDPARAMEIEPIIAELVDEVLLELSADDRFAEDANGDGAGAAEGDPEGDAQT